MSANYPDNYESGSDCIWYITVEPGHRVELQFVDFEVEGSTSATDNCRYDYVAVGAFSHHDTVDE